MPSVLSQLFRRPQGTGWLVLSGGPEPEGLARRALALVEHAGILVAVVPSARDLPGADLALEEWMDASGWEARSVESDSSDALEDALSEAALVLLPDLADAETYVRGLGQTDANEFLLAALDAGVVIVAEGAAAESLGEQIAAVDGPSGAPGLGWIPGAIIQTHFAEAKDNPPILNRNDRFRIGIPEGVSIALGPEEEREIWGEGETDHHLSGMVEGMNESDVRGNPPQRVVSLAPSITDSLLALGLGQYLAGVTDLCALPEGMENVMRVGRPERIQTADVIALHPDQILAAGEENSADQIGEWTRSDLPLWVSAPKTVRQAVADLGDLAMMFPSEAALQSVVWLDRSVDWMTGSVPEKRVRVFCPRTRRGSADDPQSWEAVGGGSYAGDLLALCGAETVFGGNASGLCPVVSPDEVIAAAPEIIILPGDPFPFSDEDAAAIRSMMPDVPAVKNNRILPVNGKLIFWPGAKLGEAIRVLPGLFSMRE